MPTVSMGALGHTLATFAFALAGGLLPGLSIEGYVLAVSAASAEAGMFPVVVAAALGQMAAKSLVYLSGRGVVSLTPRPDDDRLRRVAMRLARAERRTTALILTSALTSVPPFYAVSLAAGSLRVPFRTFFAAGCAGGLLRFAAVFALPRVSG